MNTRTQMTLTLVSLALMLAACGDEHDNHDNHDNHEHGDETPVEEGCEHMKEGPELAVTTVATATDTLPDMTKEHTRIDLTLTTGADFGTDKGGYARFEADESGEHLWFVDSDVTIELIDAATDTVLTPTQQGVAVAECSEVAVQHAYTLTAGTSYRVKIGPTSSDIVKIVVEHAE